MEFNEFSFLLRNIEPESQKKNQDKVIFFPNADSFNPENGEKAMSLDRFVSIAIEVKIFSKEKVDDFKRKHVVMFKNASSY
jgi:hypothetical protein